MSCPSCNKSVIQQTKNIVIGITNVIFKTKDVEEFALPRLQICKNCPFSKVTVIVDGLGILKCTECKCMCEAKARVKSEQCPKGKW